MGAISYPHDASVGRLFISGPDADLPEDHDRFRLLG